MLFALSTTPVEQGFSTLSYNAAKGGYPVTLRGGETASIVKLEKGWTYRVTELGRREKITCSQCNKRRYGCRCVITKKEDKR